MSSVPLYPLKFRPIMKDKIWGGQKIKTVLNKDFAPLDNCGETWEISGVPGNISVVSDGPLVGQPLPQLIESYQGELVGNKVFATSGTDFPLLVKFIDANQDLSIQVHPDDELAMSRHQSLGKTEMWYIFQADPGSSLIAGFNRPLTKEEYLQHFNQGSLTDILNKELVAADDSFFIPAGRVHTIGKGLLLAEIQQTSDVTYRIYDFDRVDKDGNKRELHVEEALDAIDYQHYPQYKTAYDRSKNQVTELAQCHYFLVNRLYYDQPVARNYQQLDSFVIYVCVEGKLTINWSEDQFITVEKGEAVLVPACIKELELIPESPFKVLEAYIP